jgi:hypothetical protein
MLCCAISLTEGLADIGQTDICADRVAALSKTKNLFPQNSPYLLAIVENDRKGVVGHAVAVPEGFPATASTLHAAS